MKEQLLETWRTHEKMNLLMIDNISPEGFTKTLTPRGRTVYEQLVHVHNVRMQWLEVCAPDIHKKYTPIAKDQSPDPAALRQAFHSLSTGMEELFARGWDNDGKVKNFKKGVIPLLGYFISHESHHRGSILLTLRQTGEKLPDVLKWGIWDWGK